MKVFYVHHLSPYLKNSRKKQLFKNSEKITNHIKISFYKRILFLKNFRKIKIINVKIKKKRKLILKNNSHIL